MRENSISNISIFDFIDDIDAFIDEWYEFHEETYQDSIPLNSFLPFHKMEYLRLNFNALPILEESTIESLSININEVLESINEKMAIDLTSPNFLPVAFSSINAFGSQFGDDNSFKDAA